tara:strand:- start:705 stop:1277 length:573 start_codon:yes stop_codon:yes gene_type:complete
MIDEFLRAKKGRLGRGDKSSINSLDKPIAKLCEKINKSDDYYTLSSCSGRIVLIKEKVDKEPGLFLFRTHKKISFKELKRELEKACKKSKDLIYLKQEPCVLAVSCRDLESEQKLLDKARIAGWKKSGITTTSKKFVIELFSTERIDVPIAKDGKILVDDNYLKMLVLEANSKLIRTFEKIKRLEKEIKN